MAKSKFFQRKASLAGLASKVAAKEIGLRASKLVSAKTKEEALKKLARIRQAEMITRNLAQMKGAAMKAGQLLSLETSEFLPPEATEILSKLQSMAEPEKYPVVEEVLRSELKDSFHLLEKIDEKALAAASIGQVHRALYKGEWIALKVQYPEVEDSIESDIQVLRKIAEVIITTTGKSIDLEETFEELQLVLKLEANYRHEIEILDFVHQKVAEHPFFYAPQPIHDLSSEKVLAMEFCKGMTLNEWIGTKPPIKMREELGKRMIDHFMVEFLDWNMVQTDPNFGNYLVQENPFKVVLLDFGSTLKYSQEFIKEYKRSIRLADQGEASECFAQAVEFGLLDQRESPEVLEKFIHMMAVSIEPFVAVDQPFDFSCVDYERRSKKAVIDFTRSLKFSPPPRKIIFLHRKLGGLFNLMKRMEVKLDLRPYWQTLMSAD